MELVEGCAQGLRVAEGKAVSNQLRESGRFEIQDAGSQQVAPFVQVAPGMRVVDLCAGAGGKTLHLAALMEGKGDLLARGGGWCLWGGMWEAWGEAGIPWCGSDGIE